MKNRRSVCNSLSSALVLCVVAITGCQDSGPTTGDTNATASETPAAPDTTTPDTTTPDTTTPDTTTPDTTTPAATPATTPEVSLYKAASEGNTEAVRQHIAAGTELNTQNPQTKATALIAATTLGHTQSALLLIENGADLEVKNSDGSTALLIAAFFCREEIVKALLAKGANRNVVNNAGSSALASVAGPFEDVKPIYDLIQAGLGPLGLELDYEYLQKARPKIAALLQAE